MQLLSGFSMHTLLMLVAAAAVGLMGGISAGLLGTSPGGALVVLSTLLLGVGQHLAQALSLAVQLPPTGLAGIRRYRAAGYRSPLRWLLWLVAAMIVGSSFGAMAAAHTTDSLLRWCYVGYLVLLDLILILRSERAPAHVEAEQSREIRTWALVSVGLVAGLSSGFLGIGGGLAVVAGLSVCLRLPQHEAQMISLMVSLMPTTIFAAYVYWRAGLLPCWWVLLAVIIGLWAGTDAGARIANRLPRSALRRVLVGMVSAMVIYMAWKASMPHQLRMR